jgi:hypothetical protein
MICLGANGMPSIASPPKLRSGTGYMWQVPRPIDTSTPLPAGHSPHLASVIEFQAGSCSNPEDGSMRRHCPYVSLSQTKRRYKASLERAASCLRLASKVLRTGLQVRIFIRLQDILQELRIRQQPPWTPSTTIHPTGRRSTTARPSSSMTLSTRHLVLATPTTVSLPPSSLTGRSFPLIQKSWQST